jgi:hypothetical protein
LRPLAILVPLVLAGALLACPKEKASVNRKDATPRPSPTAAAPAVPATASATPDARSARQREESCVDRWLAERKLDRYGSPEGTMYAGGTPLFNEATGERADRLQHVYKKHPEAKAACAPTSRTR